MIKSITIKNYILIDDLTLEFDKGFNVFTGETGAGKSIIIGAIDAALGAKVNKDVVKQGADKAYIELVIDLGSSFDKSIFEKNGIEIEAGEITVSREITNSKSIYRIEGILVNSDFIKEIRESILDIHTQHQSYNYVQPKNHIVLLDNFAPIEHRNNLNLFKEKYKKLQELKEELEEADALIASIKEREELITFQVNEIEAAAIENTDECEVLEKELNILANTERLKELSFGAYSMLNGEDSGIIDALGKIKADLTKLRGLDEDTAGIEEDFINAYETLKELSSQLRSYSENQENDTQRMDEISERLSLLEKLKRKYGSNLEEVLKTYEKLSNELSKIENSSENKEKLEFEIKELQTELDALSDVISKKRKELAPVLSKAVTEEMQKLELPKSCFEISIEPCAMNENGMDKVEFLIAVNVSEGLRPIAKTASGGEISRIMLAVKTVFAQADNTNTVIFDEIDTGISGRASQAAADEITALSKTHQIIMITHQAIIAAKADRHFYVKKVQEETAKVNVYMLEGENRIKAAALLAAGEITEESMSFARKLLENKHFTQV